VALTEQLFAALCNTRPRRHGQRGAGLLYEELSGIKR